jgi:hypothetical protein
MQRLRRLMLDAATPNAATIANIGFAVQGPRCSGFTTPMLSGARWMFVHEA